MAQSLRLYPDFNETSLVWTLGGSFQDQEGEDDVENAAQEWRRNIILKLLFLHLLMDC